MRLIVSGNLCEEEVIAEPVAIEGTNEQFGVHRALGGDAIEKGLFAVTHVGTGFAIARGDTIDEAIAAGRAAWASKTPEEIESALTKARAIRTTRIAAQQVSA